MLSTVGVFFHLVFIDLKLRKNNFLKACKEETTVVLQWMIDMSYFKDIHRKKKKRISQFKEYLRRPTDNRNEGIQ